MAVPDDDDTQGEDGPEAGQGGSRAALPALTAGVAFALATIQPLSNADTFGHLAQGRAIARAGRVPALDPFSFWRPEPQPWVNYEWLSDLVTYALFEHLGPNAVIALAAALSGGAAAGLVVLADRRGRPGAAWLAALLTLVTIPAVRFRLSARPHLIALPFAVAYLALLTSERAFADRRRALRSAGLLAGLHLLWTNLHGSHLLGLGIVGAATVAALPDRARALRLLGVAALLVAVSCVSPYGPAMFVDALLHVFDPAYRAAVTEWHSITTMGWSWSTAHAAVQGALLLVVARQALRGGSARRTWWIVAATLALSSVRSLRFLLVALLFAAPLIAVEVSHARDLTKTLRPSVLAAALVAVLATCALGLASTAGDTLRPLGLGQDLRDVPAEAAAHVEQELGGARVFASMPSSWFLLHASPSARVVVDGRVPFYGPVHVGAMQAALEHRGQLLPALAVFGANAVLVQHTAPVEAPALAAIAADPRFVRSWLDGSYAVYVTRALAAERGIDPARFDALPTGYEPAALLGADEEALPGIREDLAHLGSGPAAAAYAAFVRAMLRMRPLAREGGWAGYRPPGSDDERRRVELARRELAITERQVGTIPTLAAQRALVEALACRLDEARAHLELASAEAESRETLFGRAEIDLRAGDEAATRAFLEQARAMPGGRADAWVVALERELEGPRLCPAR